MCSEVRLPPSRIRRAVHPLLLAIVLFWCTGAATAAVFTNPVFGDSLWYETLGDRHRQPLVLIHGLGQNGARDWDPVVPALSRKFFVIRLDLPGFGRSARQNALYDPRNLAASVEALLTHLKVERAIVAGHSMGGTVALRLALDAPERVQRLVLVDAAGILHHSVFSRFLASYGVELASQQGLGLGGLLGSVVEQAFRHLDEAPVDPALALGAVLNLPELRAGLLGADPVKIAALALTLEDFSDDLDRLDLPTLLIWNERDPITPVRTAHALAARLPNARLAILPGGNHMVMAEYPERFAELIAGFAESGPEPAPPARGGRSSAAAASGSGEDSRCEGKRGMRYTGRYRRIELRDCQGVVLDGVEAEALISRASSVSIRNSAIRAPGVAIEAYDSTLEITGSEIEGETGVVLHGSSLDAAGATLSGWTHALRTTAPARVVFSISTLRTQGARRPVHGVLPTGNGSSF